MISGTLVLAEDQEGSRPISVTTSRSKVNRESAGDSRNMLVHVQGTLETLQITMNMEALLFLAYGQKWSLMVSPKLLTCGFG